MALEVVLVGGSGFLGSGLHERLTAAGDAVTVIGRSPGTAHHGVRTVQWDRTSLGDFLAISRSSIYQLIWNEQLVPVRIGRSVRFSIAQLERFVADRSFDGGAEHHSRAQ